MLLNQRSEINRGREIKDEKIKSQEGEGNEYQFLTYEDCNIVPEEDISVHGMIKHI
jgi:hypothetical protein